MEYLLERLIEHEKNSLTSLFWPLFGGPNIRRCQQSVIKSS